MKANKVKLKEHLLMVFQELVDKKEVILEIQYKKDKVNLDIVLISIKYWQNTHYIVFLKQKLKRISLLNLIKYVLNILLLNQTLIICKNF